MLARARTLVRDQERQLLIHDGHNSPRARDGNPESHERLDGPRDLPAHLAPIAERSRPQILLDSGADRLAYTLDIVQ